MTPCRPYPFGLNADEPEDEGFEAACLLQLDGFRVKHVHEELVEVAHESLQKKEQGFSAKNDMAALPIRSRKPNEVQRYSNTSSITGLT